MREWFNVFRYLMLTKDKLYTHDYYNHCYLIVLDIGCEMFYWHILTACMTYMPMYLIPTTCNSRECSFHLPIIYLFCMFLILLCDIYSWQGMGLWCIFVAIVSDSVLTTPLVALEFYHTFCCSLGKHIVGVFFSIWGSISFCVSL